MHMYMYMCLRDMYTFIHPTVGVPLSNGNIWYTW